MANGNELKANHLINKERAKRHLPKVKWSQKMYGLAKGHSLDMARSGKLFHSVHPALKGGENCWWGKGINNKNLSISIVKGWMKSPGHRAWILDTRVKTAAVGISNSKYGTYAAWSFSDEPLISPFKIKLITYRSKTSIKLQPLFKLFLLLVSAFVILLGLHGIYIYFSRIEAIFSLGQLDKLFLTIRFPVNAIQSVIEWMSYKAIQSLFFPILFIILGALIFVYSKNAINIRLIKSKIVKLFK